MATWEANSSRFLYEISKFASIKMQLKCIAPVQFLDAGT